MTTNLREEKRKATLAAIEENATKLVEERGYEAVTVEEICEAAKISRRTFFNYVDSKESAVVGAPPKLIGKDEISEFATREHPDLIAATMELCFLAIAEAQVDSPASNRLMKRRKAIRRDHPELAYARFNAFAEIHDQVSNAVLSYFDNFPEMRRVRNATAEQEAQVVMSLASQGVQIGFKWWLSSSEESTTTLKECCYTALEHMREGLVASN